MLHVWRGSQWGVAAVLVTMSIWVGVKCLWVSSSVRSVDWASRSIDTGYVLRQSAVCILRSIFVLAALLGTLWFLVCVSPKTAQGSKKPLKFVRPALKTTICSDVIIWWFVEPATVWVSTATRFVVSAMISTFSMTKNSVWLLIVRHRSVEHALHVHLGMLMTEGSVKLQIVLGFLEVCVLVAPEPIFLIRASV